MSHVTEPTDINIPSVPAKHDQFLQYVKDHPDKPVRELLEQYKQYDAELRKAFAQQPDHPAVKQPNIVPVFAGHEDVVKIRARDLTSETEKEQDRYVMPLKDENRKPNGSPAIVQSLQDFQTHLNVFSESSLADLDWSNVVVAGSAVISSLLAVPDKHARSKRTLRKYFHEELAPASDVDLFLYGLTEDQALEKIKQIEQSIRDALLVETTTIRTKHAVTIASRHPVRHVQIVLRIYKSISEILTGFDVDCSCAAYDGKQVYASPRALCAYMTQINTIDLSRRSPSYEMRLSKYARRGFEVYWPLLDRSRIDPTIFERSFARTEGLARLLILEKLPKSKDREAYLDQRREERGRPAADRQRITRRLMRGNIKNHYEDEIAEWDDEDLSNYHTVSIPYGPKFHARKIERLLFTKDMLLNAEWNKPKDREVDLHRHPAFFGRMEDIIHDCCRFCPQPDTVEEEEVAEDESKTFVSGNLSFMKDDPGRQEIGSFNPITDDDWTDMAYVGNTARLCQAIVDGDLEYVQIWLGEEGNDPNTRDYTGRAPLHLAATNSTVEVVQALIDSGARLIARLVDGRTALHLAAVRGSVEVVSALLRKSEANEEEEERKVDARRAARNAAKEGDSKATMHDAAEAAATTTKDADEDSDIDMVDDADTNVDATTEGSMVNISKLKIGSSSDQPADGVITSDEEDADVYDVNVTAWDSHVSPLHLAIVKGHVEVVKCLVQTFGADVLLPIKLFHDHDKSARAAILTLVLALQLPLDQAKDMVRTLFELGATCSQASVPHQTTALQYCVADRPELLDVFADLDATGYNRAINHLSVTGSWHNSSATSSLMTAIAAKNSLMALKLLTSGAKPEIDFAACMKALAMRFDLPKDSKQNKNNFERVQEQPVVLAIKHELALLAKTLIEEHNIDVNMLTPDGHTAFNNSSTNYHYNNVKGTTILDLVHKKLKALRNWQHEPDLPEAPEPLKEDADYLSRFKDDTYAMWSAKKQLNEAKERYKQDLERYNEKVERSNDRTGVVEKQEAVNSMIAEFEQLQTALTERGGKRFYELHPSIKKPEKRQPYSYGHYRSTSKPGPFSIAIDFRLGNLTDELQQRYESLFEAAWAGDVQTVKSLTLAPWTDKSGESQPPCTIAVQDEHQLCPFSIAVVQNHPQLASMVIDIAKIQHCPVDETQKRRYTLGDSDASDEEEYDSDVEVDKDAIRLHSDVVDDQFTIETIGEVSMLVKSRVKPAAMIMWPFCAHEFASDVVKNPKVQDRLVTAKRTNTGSIKPASTTSEKPRKEVRKAQTLIQLALYNNDLALLSFLLRLGQQYFEVDTSQDDDAVHTFTLSGNDFEYALEADHAHLLAEMMKHTGAGLPLKDLAKKHGVELQDRPKFYQGLSVHGQRRKDWAKAANNQYYVEYSENYRTPLLEATKHASLEVMEWFLSDAPMRCYKEWAANNTEEKLLRRISLSKLGFEGVVDNFLSRRSDLAMHMCLIGDDTKEARDVLQYLIDVSPETIETKSIDGVRPLQIAFELYREDAAKALIDAGADQTTRNSAGENLVHSLLSRSFKENKDLDKCRRMLNLIDKRLFPSLFLERATGGVTPLHAWLLNHPNTNVNFEVDVMKMILQYSGGQELGFVSGEGETALHVAVKTNNIRLVRVILEHDPALLSRENATGRTPFEVAEDSDTASKTENPPPMPDAHDFYVRRAKRQGWDHYWHQEVMKRPAKSFVGATPAVKESDRAQVWELLQDTKAKLDAEGNTKRRLVTLNEANEVARRLAAMKASKPFVRYDEYAEQDGGEIDDDRGYGDEVRANLSSAKKS